MKPHAFLALVLLALAAAGPASAASTLTAAELHLASSHATEGQPVLLVRDGATTDAPAFLLLAQSLRVETDERSVQALAVGTEAQTRVEQHRDARLDGLSMREGARLFVVPSDGAHAELTPLDGCSRAVPPPLAHRTHEPRVDGRPVLRVPLDDAVAWSPCTDADVRLQGDLLLVLWAWDARLTSDQGTTVLQSGRGEATAGEAWARERFLFARNATLTLPAAPQDVYLGQLSATAGEVRLADAEGRLEGDAVQGDLRLTGGVDVLVQGHGAGRPMAVTVGGTIDEAVLDDRPLVAPRGWQRWPLLVAGVGVVGVAGLQRARPHLHYLHAERTGGELGSLVPQTLRQRRAVGLWIMARRAELRRRYRVSRRRASRANDLFRPFPEAQFTRAVAEAELGHHADAMTDFLDLYHRYDEPMGRAAAACGMAQQCCRLRKWDSGQEWLLMAALESPSYAQRAALSPEFDHYDGEPWFDALRRGEAVGGRPSADPSIH